MVPAASRLALVLEGPWLHPPWGVGVVGVAQPLAVLRPEGPPAEPLSPPSVWGLFASLCDTPVQTFFAPFWDIHFICIISKIDFILRAALGLRSCADRHVLHPTQSFSVTGLHRELCSADTRWSFLLADVHSRPEGSLLVATLLGVTSERGRVPPVVEACSLPSPEDPPTRPVPQPLATSGPRCPSLGVILLEPDSTWSLGCVSFFCGH